MMLKLNCLLLGVAITGLLAGNADAQTITNDAYMCTFKSGESRLVWDGAPKKYWEKCARRSGVLFEGFTTTNLTFALSATYNTKTNRFSYIAAGSTSEFIKPGEHLLILDAMLDGRNLAYSMTSNSFRFVNAIDIEMKLISPEYYYKLKSKYSADQIFISVEAADFYLDAALTKKSQIGRGRLFAWRGNLYDADGQEFIKAECLRPKRCKGITGWIPKTSISAIEIVALPKIPFPKTYEYPTRKLIKRCNVLTKVIRSSEIKAVISAKASFAKLIKAELSASIEAALKTVREDVYEKDVKVERTIFTVFKFRQPNLFERNRWYPRKVRVLIVDRVTSDCNSDNPKSHFELRTNDGSYEITNARVNPDITSSVAYTRFVTQAQASTKGRIKVWALIHIASAMSAQRRQTPK